MSSDLKFPVMTRRGIMMCDQSPEGYITLPDWVESTDLFRDGNGQVRVDVSQNSGYTIVASIDKKGHVQLPKGYSILPRSAENPGEPHDLDLVVTDMNATPRPVIKCKGGIDWRPGAEEMARLIRENEKLTAKVAELETSNLTLTRRLQNVRKAANGGACEAVGYITQGDIVTRDMIK